MSSIVDMMRGKPIGASSRSAGGGSAARVQFILANVLVVGLVALIIFFSIRSPMFLTWVNVKVLLVNQAPLAVVVVVFTMLLIAGYIDLSVGSISAAAGLACSLLVVDAGLPRGGAILLAIGLGMAVGAINGTMCSVLKFNPIVVTLGMTGLIRGVALLFHEEQVFGLGGIFQKIAAGSIIGLPVLVWFVIISFVLGGIFIAWTPWGRHIFAIGANRQAAYLSGLSVKWLPFWLYVATGAAAALTGILMTSRLDGMTPGNAGLGLEMQVLTVVLLGGVAFAGGRGSLFGVLIAWLFLAVLQDGLVLLNASPYVQMVASGSALVLAAGIDTLGGVLTNRMQQKKRTLTQLEQAAATARE
jgi:ribose/xylose/arabinose/galactoside ABC-type transport system permease subunit